MKKRINKRKLSRSPGHRKALFRNLVSALILHGEIETTEAKAKAIKPIFEKLLTRAKENTVQARRIVSKDLAKRKLVNKLVDEIAPLYEKRAGGYTRIVRLKRRLGDNATIVKLELMVKPEVKKEEPKKKELKEEKKAKVKKTIKKPKKEVKLKKKDA